MPQLSSETDSEGRNISERDLDRDHGRREGRSPADCTPEEAAAHQVRARPILDAAAKFKALHPKVSSQCRVNSEAHFYDAVDFTSADPHKLAAEISSCLSRDYFVQVEEALPHDQQRNTTYVGGVAKPSVTEKRRSGFTGTHVHVQTAQEKRPHVVRDRNL